MKTCNKISASVTVRFRYPLLFLWGHLAREVHHPPVFEKERVLCFTQLCHLLQVNYGYDTQQFKPYLLSTRSDWTLWSWKSRYPWLAL